MFQRKAQQIKITANYHTHTKRCGHAVGEDREYVEAAIKAGIQILGFSDHTAYPTGTAYRSGMRMSLAQTEGYFHSITNLREEYKKDIQIYVGVEAEYFPEHFEKLTDFLKDYPVDYMILGNHFVNDEEHGAYVGAKFTDKRIMELYAENVIAAIRTGRFLYVAHPDLPNYEGNDREQVLGEAFHRICKAAKECNVPLEINMLGHMRRIQYPSDTFFKIAAEYENDVIIGMDVHNPKDFGNHAAQKACVKLAQKHGLRLLEELAIVPRV